MSDQVSMVWILRNVKTHELLIVRDPMALIIHDHSSSSVCIFATRDLAAEFALTLSAHDAYEPSYEPLSIVGEFRVMVNPEATSENAKLLKAYISEV